MYLSYLEEAHSSCFTQQASIRNIATLTSQYLFGLQPSTDSAMGTCNHQLPPPPGWLCHQNDYSSIATLTCHHLRLSAVAGTRQVSHSRLRFSAVVD
jgi:hypothetical protein